MVYTGYSLFMMVKVIFLFIILCIAAPGYLLGPAVRDSNWSERLFTGLIHSLLMITAAVHLLVVLRIFETVSLVVSLAVLYLAARWFLGSNPSSTIDAIKTAIAVKILDWSDLNGQRDTNSKEHNCAGFFLKGVWRQFHSLLQHPISYGVPLVLFTASVLAQLAPALAHADLDHNMYSMLTSVRSVGNGVLPYHFQLYGVNAFVAGVSKLTLIEPYWLIRYLFPLAPVFFISSIFLYSARLSGNHRSAAAAMITCFLLLGFNLTEIFAAQKIDFGTVFAITLVLPALWYFWLYMSSGQRSDLLLFAESSAAMILFNPAVAGYFGATALLIIIGSVLYKKARVSAEVVWFTSGIISLIAGAVFFTNVVVVSCVPFIAMVAAVGWKLLEKKNVYRDVLMFKNTVLKAAAGILTGVVIAAFILNITWHRLDLTSTPGDNEAENYLAVERSLPFADWLIVSNPGTAWQVSHNKNYVDINSFLDRLKSSPDLRLESVFLPGTRHLIVFVEKKNPDEALYRWIGHQRKSGEDVTVFFENSTLAVYQMNRPRRESKTVEGK